MIARPGTWPAARARATELSARAQGSPGESRTTLKAVLLLSVAIALALLADSAQAQTVSHEGIAVDVVYNTDICEEQCHTVYRVCGVPKLTLSDVSADFEKPNKKEAILKNVSYEVEKDDDCYTVTVRGEKNKFENIDNILNVNGVRFPEFIWWNSTYPHRMLVYINISSGAVTAGYQIMDLKINTANAPDYWNWTNVCVGGNQTRAVLTDVADLPVNQTVMHCNTTFWHLAFAISDELNTSNLVYPLYWGNQNATPSNSIGVVFPDFSQNIENCTKNEWLEDADGLKWVDTTITRGGCSYVHYGTGAGATQSQIEIIDLNGKTLYYEVYFNDTAALAYTQAGDTGSSSVIDLSGMNDDSGVNAVYYDGSFHFGTTIYAANRWHTVEFKNINWGAKTFEIFVNGANELSGAMSTRNTMKGNFSFLSSGVNGKASYWDNMLVRRYDTDEGGITLNYGATQNYSAPGSDTMTMIHPYNQTYIALPIPINVTTTAGVYGCKWNLDGGTNTSMTNDSLTNWYSDISAATIGLHNLTTYCTNQTGALLSDNVWLSYFLVPPVTEVYRNVTFETTTEEFSIVVNMSGASEIYTISWSFYYNDTLYPVSGSFSGDIVTAFSTVPIPEHASGNASFRWNYTIRYYTFDGPSYSSSTDVKNQTIYLINITNCTAGNISLNLLLRDEANGSAVNGNLDTLFRIDTVSGLYDVNKNISFALENKTEFSICIDPFWATFTLDSWMQYGATGYSPRTYYLSDATISNVTQNITLYLADNATTTLITMRVLNSLGLPEEDVMINIARYDLGTDTYSTIAIAQSDFDGYAYQYLTLNTVWYRFTLYRNGVVLNVYGPIIIVDDTLTFQLTDQPFGEWLEYYGQIAGGCTFPNNTTLCTVTDTSGLMQSATLSVKRWTSLGYIDVCDVVGTSSSVILVCSLGTSSSVFWYEFVAHFENTRTVIQSGYVDNTVPDTDYQDLGLIGALFLILVLSMMGAWRWEMGMVGAGLGMGVSYILGLELMGWGSVVTVFVIIAIVIYQSRTT